MMKYSAEIAFGKAVYYSDYNNNLKFLSKSNPVFTELYEADKTEYDFNKVLKYLMLYQDSILGAAVIIDRLVLEKYLNEINGKVKYIEDNTVMALATLEHRRIYYFNEYILWYECDSGISTNNNRGYWQKIQFDFYACYKMLNDKYPNNIVVRVAYLEFNFMINKNKLALSFIKRIINKCFGRKKYRKTERNEKLNKFLTVFDINNLYKWREYN